MTEEIVRLATEAIENQFAYYSGDVVLDAKTFYVPVLRLVAENERLREALRAAGLAPSVVDAIAKGEPQRPCPAGHSDQCCGYPAACEAALSGRKDQHDSSV